MAKDLKNPWFFDERIQGLIKNILKYSLQSEKKCATI